MGVGVVAPAADVGLLTGPGVGVGPPGGAAGGLGAGEVPGEGTDFPAVGPGPGAFVDA